MSGVAYINKINGDRHVHNLFTVTGTGNGDRHVHNLFTVPVTIFY